MEIQQTAQGTITLTYSQNLPATSANVAAAFEYLTAYLRENVPADCLIQQPFAFMGDEGNIGISITIQSPLRKGFPTRLNF